MFRQLGRSVMPIIRMRTDRDPLWFINIQRDGARDNDPSLPYHFFLRIVGGGGMGDQGPVPLHHTHDRDTL